MITKKNILNGKLFNISNNHYFYFLLFGAAIYIGLLPYFSGGFFLLGGDGDYHLSYTRTLRYIYTWSEDGLGLPNYGICSIWSFVVLFSCIENIVDDVATVKFILNFLQYFLCFTSIYLVCKELKVPPFLSFIISLFYVLNPFSLSYLTRLNMSLTIIPSVMMFYFLIILKHYHNNIKLFIYFGLLSSFLAFSNTNPPLLVILQISIFLSVNIASYYINDTYRIKEIVRKYFVVLISFILFNFWWLINWYPFISSGTASKMYTQDTADSFLTMVIGSSGVILPRILTFRAGFTIDPSQNFFGYYYNSIPFILISLIPIMIVCYFTLIKGGNPKTRRLIYGIFLVCLGILFLAKGNSAPFGFVYDFMFRHLPFFNIFKGPLEKFGLLYLFTFSVLLIYIMNELIKCRNYNKIIALFLLYIIVCSVPLFSGNMVPDSVIGEIRGYTGSDDYETLKYKEMHEYKDIRRHINSEEAAYRVLSFPGSRDYYAVTFHMYDNKYYSGVDPILSNTDKPYLIYNNETAHLYTNITNTDYKKLLGLYNIKKIMVNEDLIPRYGIPEKESPSQLKKKFSRFMKDRQFGNKTIYDNQNYFLPRIYVSSF